MENQRQDESKPGSAFARHAQTVLSVVAACAGFGLCEVIVTGGLRSGLSQGESAVTILIAFALYAAFGVLVGLGVILAPRLLADEPTGSLDHENAEMLGNLLVEIQKNMPAARQEQKVTLIIVTHSLELAEKMDKTYKLINGTLN